LFERSVAASGREWFERSVAASGREWFERSVAASGREWFERSVAASGRTLAFVGATRFRGCNALSWVQRVFVGATRFRGWHVFVGGTPSRAKAWHPQSWAYTPPMSDFPGVLLVLCGPSGVGKTTIAHRLCERFGGIFSVSATTRNPRPGEKDGRDYHFTNREAFERDLTTDRFLEHALVFGTHFYGTPREPVERALAEGRLMLLDIDVQGALQIRRSLRGALLVFILPPDDSELLRRLRERGSDDAETIERRFAEARQEVAIARASGAFDEFITNDNLDAAVGRIVGLINERLRRAELPSRGVQER